MLELLRLFKINNWHRYCLVRGKSTNQFQMTKLMKQKVEISVGISKYNVMKIVSLSFIAILLLFINTISFGQYRPVVVDVVIVDGDTIPVVNIEEVEVFGNKKRDRKFKRKHDRLERKVVKVYPYAKAAGKLMKSYEEELSKITNERDRKKFIALAESELKRQFEGDLLDMTISEGVILIKLIDRETGDSSYELIKDLKGGISAIMWQGVARIFSHDLKESYDPYEELDDEVIEYIIDKIEYGVIKVETKEVNIMTSEMVKRRK